MEVQTRHDAAQPVAPDAATAPHPEVPTTPIRQRLAELAHSKALPHLSVIAITLLASHPSSPSLIECYGGGHHG